MSDSVQPHRWQPIRLRRLWDSPSKNTGVRCHFLLQCMKMKSESEVAQLCQTLSDLMDCSLPGSSIHGIFQARVLEWGATAFSAWPTECTKNSNNNNRQCLHNAYYTTGTFLRTLHKLTHLRMFCECTVTQSEV